MKLLILGLGNVGKALAEGMKAQGHEVVGTTTTQSKVADLEKIASSVAVLTGKDTEKIAEAASGCDAIVVTVAPNVRKARNLEEREATYHDALVASCVSAANACARVIFLSSFSVYGDGGEGSDPISEQTPTSNHEEPSSKYYQMAEQAVLANDQGCVLRLPDIYGAPGDMSFADRVKLGHEIMGGKVPFGPDAPLYSIHYLDVADATKHVLLNHLSGVFNVCDNEDLPPSNKSVFDGICEKEGLPLLTFLDQIKAPNRKISAQKLYDSGFALSHTKSDPPF